MNLTFLPAISRSHAQATNSYALAQIQCQISLIFLINGQIAPDNSSISSDPEMVTLFNEYFSSVFTVEDITTIPTAHLTTFTSVSDSIEFTPSIVFSKVMNLQSGKSLGPDGWPIEIIK